MTAFEEFQSEDLVLFVWPRQSEPEVRAGLTTWREVAAGDWAMDAQKAERVSVVVAVYDDTVRGAWRVQGVTHDLRIPEGKSRNVNRSSFDLLDEPRLAYLVGATSPLGRRRNPQATIELRDLPGADLLLGSAESQAASTVAHVGRATVSAREDGSIDVVVPAGTTVTVRTITDPED